jgi:hypothetical protein
LQLKAAAHIPGRINVATDRLSRLEMSRNKLSPERRSISNDSVEIEMFYKNKPVCIKNKQASKYISNSKK